MASGIACRDDAHRQYWRVLMRNANRSAFNGYRRTTSDYSAVHCPVCHLAWRTKAAYVATLPDA
jgi:hypothetical protein